MAVFWGYPTGRVRKNDAKLTAACISERAFRTAMGFVMPQWTAVKFLKARADTGARKTYFETFETRGRAPEEDR